jgi:glycosyltransferase involved in cell wall biosynthesis
MSTEAKPSFAFLVVTYNHQEYILEHLESIKYLVQTHGSGRDVDLIVNDDCSRDETRTLVDRWLAVNTLMFRHVKTLYNPKNLGTCASVSNMLKHMVADRCKLTAGDDVYSFENIFEVTSHDRGVAILSGRELRLTEGELSVDPFANFLACATQVIYREKSIAHRFKHFSYNNAPNIIYATECLRHPAVLDYLQKFDVIEDWPLQIAISRYFRDYKFELIHKVLVYYRRTLGSTYIVASQRFFNDKNRIYEDLILHEDQYLEQLRLKSRKLCFNMRHQVFKKLINLDAYYFLIESALRLAEILREMRFASPDIEQHKKHYSKIRNSAIQVRSVIDGC